ncbi:MAG: HPr family phosphocarrier protein [Planctomycetes bacterium]|nr:HPr family phosphocarrier protein [Planctomycetota bacterium]
MATTVEREVTVESPNGLHARPSHAVVALVTGFKAQVQLELNGRVADARSILGVMTLGAAKGDVVVVRADGPDAESAVNSLAALFASAFGEAG